jgi:hypothetical protein
MSGADALSKSLWKRSGGKGSLNTQSSIMNSSTQNLKDYSELEGNSQINSETRKDSSSCEDLIVPEINRTLILDCSAEKDFENAQTHYTDTNSSIFNSSLKSSLGQKCLSQGIEDNEESDDCQDHTQKNYNGKVLTPVPRFPFKLSPKVQNGSDIVIFPKAVVNNFEESSPTVASGGDKRAFKLEFFKPHVSKTRSLWTLKEDTSVTLQVNLLLNIDRQFIYQPSQSKWANGSLCITTIQREAAENH